MSISLLFSKPFRGLAEGKCPRSPALAAALILLPWIILQLVLFRPYYLVNDDILKVLMAKGFGSGGVPSDLFEGSNALLGIFFKWWFSLFPNEPWFGWFLYGLQALALWGFLWAELSRPKPWWRIVLFLAAMEGIHFLFFVFLQFDIVSILTVQSGLWLLVASFEAEKKAAKIGLALTACCFLWIISILRPDAFLLGMVLALPLCLPGSGIDLREVRKPLYRSLLIALGVLIALGFLFHSVHSSRSPEWKDFWAFHREANGLNEYRSAQYDRDTRSIFDQVGWSSNDLWLFKNWYWMDPDKFSTVKLQALNDRFPRWGLGEKYGAYSSWTELLGSHWDFRILLWSLVLVFFCGAGRLRSWAGIAGMVFLILGILLYWFKATDRVTLPVLTFLVTGAIHFVEVPSLGSRTFHWRYGAGALALLVLGVLSIQEVRLYRAQNLERRVIEERFDANLKTMEPLSDRLIVLWDFPLECVGVFDGLERFRPFHLFLMASSQRSPAQAGLLKEYGLEDFGKGMVDNPRVLLNCSAEEGAHLAVYLQENKGIRVRPEKVYECEYFKVFALHSKP